MHFYCNSKAAEPHIVFHRVCLHKRSDPFPASRNRFAKLFKKSLNSYVLPAIVASSRNACHLPPNGIGVHCSLPIIRTRSPVDREDIPMPRAHPPATASIAGIPIRALLSPFPIVCFIGALLTDITYWQTAEMMWADFSAWLVTVGLIMGVLAFIAGLSIFSAIPACAHRHPSGFISSAV